VTSATGRETWNNGRHSSLNSKSRVERGRTREGWSYADTCRRLGDDAVDAGLVDRL
jgi:hypothetical protein